MQEATDREKEHLVRENDQLTEEIHLMKSELLESRGKAEVLADRLEMLQEEYEGVLSQRKKDEEKSEEKES